MCWDQARLDWWPAVSKLQIKNIHVTVDFHRDRERESQTENGDSKVIETKHCDCPVLLDALSLLEWHNAQMKIVE